MHYESTESPETWENFTLLADKRLQYFVETNFEFTKPTENWIKTNFHLKVNAFCNASQTFIINYLICLSKTFKTLRKMKNHQDSNSSADSRIHFALGIWGNGEKLRKLYVINKYKTGCQFSEFKLILRLQYYQNWKRKHITWKKLQGSRDTRSNQRYNSIHID